MKSKMTTLTETVKWLGLIIIATSYKEFKMSGRSRVRLILAVAAWNIASCHGGMNEFLIDAMYSIQSGMDRGYLTIRDSAMKTYKLIQPEPWKSLPEQKWMVNDFQSIGLYDFTPIMFNTTDNMVTFEPTKNAYTYKKQWKVILVTTDKYIIKNPDSGWCLTNVGSYKEVMEQICNKRLTLNQLWKFRMLRS